MPDIDFVSYSSIISKGYENKDKNIKSLDISIVANDYEGEFHATDIQIQEGLHKTLYNPHTTEFLDGVKFGINERAFIDTVGNPVKLGVQPRKLKDLKNRFYNIIGRGHEALSLPNVFHEDYRQELVSTGVDLTLIPKNDYDLLRISTNQGSYIQGRAYHEDNPLNYIYTREFFFPKGKKGDVIELKASDFKALVNGNSIPLNRGKIIPNTDMDVTQRFMILPFGSFRMRVEFYKLVPDKEGNMIYKDTGIGFTGLAEFKQYKKGASF